MSGDITIFICGRATRPRCYACTNASETRCAVEGCDRPLCDTHTRHAEGQDRCSQHAPMQVNHTMPKPPGRR